MIKVLKKRSKSQIDLNSMKKGNVQKIEILNKEGMRIEDKSKESICKINSGENLDRPSSRMSGGSSLSKFSNKEKNYEYCNVLIKKLNNNSIEENLRENNFDIEEYMKNDYLMYLKEKEDLKMLKIKKQHFIKNILLEQIREKQDKINKNFKLKISEEININNIVNQKLNLDDENEKIENFIKMRRIKEELDFQNQMIEAKRKEDIKVFKENEKKTVDNILVKINEDKFLKDKAKNKVNTYRKELKAEIEMKSKNSIDSQLTERLLDKFFLQDSMILEKKYFKKPEKTKKGKKVFVNNSIQESSPIFNCLRDNSIFKSPPKINFSDKNQNQQKANFLPKINLR